MVRLALSRSREFLADAGSVELAKNPDAMISALRKIENRGELPGATSAVMELCLDNPRQGFSDLFATHPSVDARVQALVKFAGGRDPGPLALPSDPPTGSRPRDGQTPPPLPKGPWSDADLPACRCAVLRLSVPLSGPWGSATEPSTGPSSGPWGPH